MFALGGRSLSAGSQVGRTTGDTGKHQMTWADVDTLRSSAWAAEKLRNVLGSGGAELCLGQLGVWLPRGLGPLDTHRAFPGSTCARGTVVALTARGPQVSRQDSLRTHLGLALSLSVPPPG